MHTTHWYSETVREILHDYSFYGSLTFYYLYISIVLSTIPVIWQWLKDKVFKDMPNHERYRVNIGDVKIPDCVWPADHLINAVLQNKTHVYRNELHD